MMGWYGGGMGWGGWLVMTLVMVVFWGLVIAALIAIFRSSKDTSASTDHHRDRDPLSILDERFARGEIDETEYHARAEVLRAVSR